MRGTPSTRPTRVPYAQKVQPCTRRQRPTPTVSPKYLYRAPYSDKWQEKSWDWAIAEIAKRAKTTRDANFVEKNAKGEVVNRVEAIAHLGSSNIDNEECWALNDLVRSLGVVYMDHQARI